MDRDLSARLAYTGLSEVDPKLVGGLPRLRKRLGPNDRAGPEFDPLEVCPFDHFFRMLTFRVE